MADQSPHQSTDISRLWLTVTIAVAGGLGLLIVLATLGNWFPNVSTGLVSAFLGLVGAVLLAFADGTKNATRQDYLKLFGHSALIVTAAGAIGALLVT
ncbi:hypothetical protein [Microbacterium saperdae]|nr:hypothetical protein [Microbacterium saperdae]